MAVSSTTAKPPNLNHRQYFWIYGNLHHLHWCTHTCTHYTPVNIHTLYTYAQYAYTHWRFILTSYAIIMCMYEHTLYSNVCTYTNYSTYHMYTDVHYRFGLRYVHRYLHTTCGRHTRNTVSYVRMYCDIHTVDTQFTFAHKLVITYTVCTKNTATPTSVPEVVTVCLNCSPYCPPALGRPTGCV